MYRTRTSFALTASMMLSVVLSGAAVAGDAPAWMRAQVAAPLPEHDEKTDAVVLYSESILTVQPNGKMKRIDRKVIKILRPDGESRAAPHFFFGPENSITDIHGWCIPVSGKDYEVKARDAIDSVADIDGSDLISDVRMKTLRIPGGVVGSIVGYEVESELHLYFQVVDWYFQDNIPVREARFTLQLPTKWQYQANWVNHDAVAASTSVPNQWSWSLRDIAAVRAEPRMPPWRGLAARMVVWLHAEGSTEAGIQSWNDIGAWYDNLARGRRDASPAIEQKVGELTASLGTPLAKMQALAGFMQNQMRYVAIELGIGGHQPHPATEIFVHRYGDCKDNATLMSAMLNNIGVQSYYVVINTERGAVTPATPPNLDFDHMILAVALPAGIDTKTLNARIEHPKLGQLLFFDPTDDLTPFGSLRGDLQANYGLLVSAGGGELIKLPQLAPQSNGVARVAKLALDETGTLSGDIREIRVGGNAARQRYALRSATADTDKIKPIEAIAGASLSSFQILKASVRNARAPELPLEWNYTLEASKYAKLAGDLVLVRPRVIGRETQGFLEAKEPRVHPIEFQEPELDSDTVEITLPPGYALDDLPPSVNLDEPYASYHSKVEFKDGVLRYSRVFELKQLSMPASKAIDMRNFYRVIYNDERNSAVFKQAGK